MDRLLGRWSQNAPASSAYGARPGCFGEKGPTPNPGRGLRFPASRLPTRNSPHPHPNAANKNRGLTAYNKTARLVPKTQALPLL